MRSTRWFALLSISVVGLTGCGDSDAGASPASAALSETPAVSLVSKQTAVFRDFRFENGRRLDSVSLGYETYGRLNAAKNNVIVLAPFLAGHSHAAGKFAAADPAPGWWDALIGPGRAIDTDKYFVVSTDVLSLPRSKPSIVVTTGPASKDANGNHFGPLFPEFSVLDQVNAQRRLLGELGIDHVHAVLGASMGGMIAWQWGVSHPESVDLVIPVAAPIGYSDAERQGLALARSLIERDPDWQDGRYYGTGREPNRGVGIVLALLNGAIAPAPNMQPKTDVGWKELYDKYQKLLQLSPEQRSQQVAQQMPDFQKFVDRAQAEFEGGHFVHTFRMFEKYGVRPSDASQAVRFVAIGFEDDNLVKKEHLAEVDAQLTAAGLRHRVAMFPGGKGHLSCLLDTDSFAGVIAEELREAPRYGMK